METNHQSRMISRVLAPAVQLWLRSQVEAVEVLQVTIAGGDRHLLRGHIPQVAIRAQRAVYQGLHLSHVELAATDIRINVGQVVKGKPLKLLAVVPIEGIARLTQDDLTASLRSPLLRTALAELLADWLKADSLPPSLTDLVEDGAIPLDELEAGMDQGQLAIAGKAGRDHRPFILRTGLQAEGTALRLNHPTWFEPSLSRESWSEESALLASSGQDGGILLQHLHGALIHLGSDVDIQDLTLEQGEFFCRGRLMVNP